MPTLSKNADTQSGSYDGVVLSRDEKQLIQQINRVSNVIHQLEHLGEQAPRVGERVRIAYAAQTPTVTKLALDPKLVRPLARGLHV